ncbi:MAG TPA: lysophospholipid acyltransferase family protein, partial [Thermodesulfobacteriota bacterium]|nr:lysophospholipid acyltransferase family protein [Thermodesulfobacteriota bacterium]
IIIKSLPEATLYSFSHILGNAYFLLSHKRRKRTIRNLTFVYQKEKSSEEITRLAKQIFCNIAEATVETAIRLLKDPDLRQGLIRDISVEGAQYLDKALKTKKGVICIGTHLGNFLFLARRLSLVGYPANIVIKDSDYAVVAEIWHILMRKAGFQWIPARPRIKAVSDSLKWLKKGGILFLYADQEKRDGVLVKFFNHQMGTVEGPAILHLRTGAEILCAFMIKLGRRKHKIIITPPITVKKSGHRKEDVYRLTQAFTEIIESFVKQYPEQWWWPWRRKMKHS